MPAHRFDTSSWLPAAVLFGDDGFGVIGSLIPSGGTNGPAYCYNDLSLPADAAKEICGRITLFPSAGNFKSLENTSFAFSGAPDGLYNAVYSLYVDGVNIGVGTITLVEGSVGIVPGVGTITITGYAPTVLQTQSANPGVGSITLTGYAPTVEQAAPGSQSVTAGVGTITLTGYAPTVSQSGTDKQPLGGHHRGTSARTRSGEDAKFQEYVDFVDKLVADEASDLEDAEFAEVISILHAVGALQ